MSTESIQLSPDQFNQVKNLVRGDRLAAPNLQATYQSLADFYDLWEKLLHEVTRENMNITPDGYIHHITTTGRLEAARE